MNDVTIRVLRDPEADPEVPLPAYETAGAAGADIRANLSDRGTLTLAPGARALVPTGLRLEIPPGFEVQVRPRSGLALKHGITLPNSPGTIDSDYRGPLGVILMNAGDAPFTVNHGDRIAQIDDPEHFKVVADIDEFYLSRVDIGQRADYPLDGTTYQLQVAKIRPQVQNGQFQVELTFHVEPPLSGRVWRMGGAPSIGIDSEVAARW